MGTSVNPWFEDPLAAQFKTMYTAGGGQRIKWAGPYTYPMCTVQLMDGVWAEPGRRGEDGGRYTMWWMTW